MTIAKTKPFLFLLAPILLVTVLEAQAPAGPVLSLSANGSAEAKLIQGWPLVLRGLIQHPLAAVRAEAAPIEIAPPDKSWADAVEIRVMRADGPDDSWRFQLNGTPESASLRLGQRERARMQWLLDPGETAVLAPGTYRLMAKLDTAQSRPITVEIIVPPEQLSDAQQLEKGLIGANYHSARSDLPAALEALKPVLEAQPESIVALGAQAEIYLAQNQLLQALLSVSKALAAVDKREPKSKEPPEELLMLKNAILDRMGRVDP
jgi:tetratricopeptide (TPR) repeat protein